MPFRSGPNLALVVLAPLVLLLLALNAQGRDPVLSRWGLPAAAAQGGLVGNAEPLAGAAEPVQAAPPSVERLEAYNTASALQESVADGRVRLFRRAVGGGELAYIVAMLDERVRVAPITADGALPASDETGDTIWADRGRHLRTVAEMAGAPYARREGLDLLGAIAFSYHGAERTSPEGSVVIDGVVHRVNAGRGALCVTAEQTARIGKLSAEELAGCAQAIGGGPVIVWGGKLANPDVAAETAEFLPFNPLGEDFVQLDWRVKIYRGRYPKTAVCVGDRPDGRSFVVLANSANMSGLDLAGALRDMGCHSALGGDDDTSTQAVWRGRPVWGVGRAVPDALAVYAAP